MNRLLPMLMALLLCLSMMACKPEEEPVDYVVDPATSYTVSLPRAEGETNFVQITMEGGATMVVELYPDKAPITVANFKRLVSEGFYDGLTFHRVYKNFMIQGGSSTGTGASDPNAETILGEFNENPDFTGNNDILHTRGVISMARTSIPNSASTQFFIMHAANTGLDGKYAAFGCMVAGWDTLDTIANLAVTYQSSGERTKPVERVVIESVYFVNFEG